MCLRPPLVPCDVVFYFFSCATTCSHRLLSHDFMIQLFNSLFSALLHLCLVECCALKLQVLLRYGSPFGHRYHIGRARCRQLTDRTTKFSFSGAITSLWHNLVFTITLGSQDHTLTIQNPKRLVTRASHSFKLLERR